MAEAGGTRSWPEETVPVLRVSNAKESAAWYKRLGFRLEWEHRFEPNLPVFASIRRGEDGAGVRLFLTEHTGGGVPFGSHVYLRVTDVEPVAMEFRAPVHRVDGRLEILLQDPDGNTIRVGSPSGSGRGHGYTYPDQSA